MTIVLVCPPLTFKNVNNNECKKEGRKRNWWRAKTETLCAVLGVVRVFLFNVWIHGFGLFGVLGFED